jgi:hypothetical protein
MNWIQWIAVSRTSMWHEWDDPPQFIWRTGNIQSGLALRHCIRELLCSKLWWGTDWGYPWFSFFGLLQSLCISLKGATIHSSPRNSNSLFITMLPRDDYNLPSWKSAVAHPKNQSSQYNMSSGWWRFVLWYAGLWQDFVWCVGITVSEKHVISSRSFMGIEPVLPVV